MNLVAVHFDAFRSLVDRTLNFTHPCLGLVGINESGKSNVLKGIRLLHQRDMKLSASDRPKMARNLTPKIRFEFSLTEEDLQSISELLSSKLTEFPQELFDSMGEMKVFYVCTLSRGEEERYFQLSQLQVPASINAKIGNDFDARKIVTKSGVIGLDDIQFATDAAIAATKEKIEVSRKYERQLNELEQLKAKKNKLESIDGTPNAKTSETPSSQPPLSRPPNLKLIKLEDQIQKAESRLSEFDVSTYDHQTLVSELESELEGFNEKLAESSAEISAINDGISKLEKTKPRNATQNNKLAAEKKQLSVKKGILDALNRSIKDTEHELKILNEPIDSLFTNDADEIARKLGTFVKNELSTLMPKVVFWQHSEEFVLNGETEFDSILAAKSTDDISRPLLNLFRIGLEIGSLQDLQDQVRLIQQDGSERRRCQHLIKARVNEHLSQVWTDYDQEIEIALEKERICVQFFDPKRMEEASFFDFHERSQGCQAFISFLLTVGAEAKKGVIANTVLLLDEPETHLHPSGVRFMLKELISAADNDNLVVFATHSIFMIDRENYDRHIIVKKDLEKTQLIPSQKDRIGFFMQEEVLYGALDIKPSDEKANKEQFNFVFEGDGDAEIFSAFYENALTPESRPFPIENCSFQHGGGCKNIRKYFKSMPIQLETKWILILDSDKPANQLIEMLASRYADFLGKYVFLYQFKKDQLEDVELEDLLPSDILLDAAFDTGQAFGKNIDLSDEHEIVGFNIFFDEISGGLTEKQKKEFKAIFKENLNRNIQDRLAEIQDAKSFEEGFPDFVQFGKTVVSAISESVKKKTAKTKSSKEKPAKEKPAKEKPAKEKPAKEKPEPLSSNLEM